MQPTILIAGTLDTKGREASFLKEQVEALGAKALLLDGGIKGEPTIKPDITHDEVAASAGSTLEEVRKIPTGEDAMAVMIKGAGAIALDLWRSGKIHGVLGVGGGMGTNFGTGVMRALPIGVPKVMVTSQGANPDVVKYAVGTKDICMFNAVADVADINRLTRTIFARAAGAVVGMANAEVKQGQASQKTVVVCAKGHTEEANRAIRQRLIDAGYEVLNAHCWGYGPAALEQLIRDGFVDGGIIEIASDWLDHIAGGSSYPPEDRYENAGQIGLPQVFVPGCCDFVAAPPGSCPGGLPNRKVYPYNPGVSLYRSTKEELLRVGREVGEKLAKSKGPVTVVIPLRGFSRIDREGAPLYDPDADAGFWEGISAFKDKIRIIRVDAHIFDEQFIDAVMEAFFENMRAVEQSSKSA